MYDKAVGHEIKWKEDKDLTKKVEIKKQRNKSQSSLSIGYSTLTILRVTFFPTFWHPPSPSRWISLRDHIKPLAFTCRAIVCEGPIQA